MAETTLPPLSAESARLHAARAIEGGPATLAHYDNYLIDSDSRVILAVEATPARFRQETTADKQSQRARYKIEALFAELKQQMRSHRVRLRRTWNVTEQFLLAVTAQNLKRMVRFLAQRNGPEPNIA